MLEEPQKTIEDLVKDVGRYPEEAFHFVGEGLGYAAEQIHGPETECIDASIGTCHRIRWIGVTW